jgi:hypothetical protein
MLRAEDYVPYDQYDGECDDAEQEADQQHYEQCSLAADIPPLHANSLCLWAVFVPHKVRPNLCRSPIVDHRLESGHFFYAVANAFPAHA